MWNTFQGLGMRSVTSEVRSIVISKGAPGRKRRGKVGKRLDPHNLAHRCHPKRDYALGRAEQLFEKARVLSLELDRHPDMEKSMQHAATIQIMRQAGLDGMIRKLIRLERCRGCHRTESL